MSGNGRATGQVLRGAVIAVTRPVNRASTLTSSLETLGATVVNVPAIELLPPPTYERLDSHLARLQEYEWLVFTSAAAADAVCTRLAATGRHAPGSLRIAVVGATTAAAARACFGRVDFTGDSDADSLAASLPVHGGDRVLFVCGDRARDALPARLEEQGMQLDRVVAYRTRPVSADAIAHAMQERGVDLVILASPSAAAAVGAALHIASLTLPPAVCIGQTTADAAQVAGFAIAAVAAAHTEAALVDATIHALAPHPS